MVGEQPVMRVFRCRPLRGAFDEILRQELIPELRRLPGSVAVYVGRQGPDDTGTRVVVSIWTSHESMVSAMGSNVESSAFHPEYLAETADRSVEVLPLELTLMFGARATTGILRFARGRVHPAEMADYLAGVRIGTERDAAAGVGPIALFVALAGTDSFVTLSIWRTWSDIEAATGADIDRPISTQRADRLEVFDADHYELVP